MQHQGRHDAGNEEHWLGGSQLNVQQRFANAEALIAEAQPVARAIRNDIFAHVLESAVQEVLEQINPDAFGLLDFGRLENWTSYGFAHELIAAMLMKDVPDDQKRDLYSSVLSRKYVHIVAGFWRRWNRPWPSR